MTLQNNDDATTVNSPEGIYEDGTCLKEKVIDSCKIAGWLKVFESAFQPDPDDDPQWHDGFVVCRPDEMSLICFVDEQAASQHGPDLPSHRVDMQVSVLALGDEINANVRESENSQNMADRPRPRSLASMKSHPSNLPITPSRRLLPPGLSATIDRVTARRSKSRREKAKLDDAKPIDAYDYVERSSTMDPLSKYYGSESTVDGGHGLRTRSKSAKTLAGKLYYSTLRTIRGGF